MTMDKAALLTARFGVEEIDIPGVGSVKVRPLSRAEALEIKGVETPYDELERKLLSWALVEPKLTADEVRTWQENSPAGELEVITQAIIRMSGFSKNAPREAMTTFRG